MKKLIIIALILIANAPGAEAQRTLVDKKPVLKRTSQVEQVKLNAPWINERIASREKHTLSKSYLQPNSFEAVQQERSKGKRIWIDDKGSSGREKPKTLDQFLKTWQDALPLRSVQEELKLQSVSKDDLGWQHHRLQQFIGGVPVFGGEVIAHSYRGEFVRMNGQLQRSPANVPEPIVNEKGAVELVASDLAKHTITLDRESLVMRLLVESEFARDVVFVDEMGKAHRSWHVKHIPNHQENWEYLIDAIDGTILKKWNNVCTIHNHSNQPSEIACASVAAVPPSTGQSPDLDGVNKELRIFDDGGTYFMVDASREMFQSIGNAQSPPVGAIMTYDTKNQPINEDGFYPNELVSSTNANSWDPKAVSAHINAGFVYEYFRQIFSRNSINGAGGSIYSFINVVNPENGEDFDNAFWNEKIMFYGNGDFQFNRPLQAAVDVASHEVSHGVIQNTAGLIYQDESGAINESIADFFGAAAEARSTGVLDWKIGNTVANPNFFRSGTMRDMANPNNGGLGLNDAGFQPQFYGDRYIGREDNGGVHINSGIPNHAFHLLTEAIGLDKAEQVVYRALTQYLTRSSVFADLRKGMLAAATDIHGQNSAEASAVAEAFDFVQISDGPGSSAPVEADVNPGLDLLVASYSLQDQMDLYQITESVDEIASPWLSEIPLKPPTVTDDGTILVYVTQDNKLKFVSIDYNTGESSVDFLSENPIWRNVDISRDGTKIAALTTDNDNTIWIFDLINDNSRQFELSNPTFTAGVSTDNVQFADALDWDFSGELLMYDASNLISAAGGEEFTYWDIGFIEVYDNEAGTFADGNIFKLVSGLPDNVSIGNPVFSKNSPNIIALDYIETVQDPIFGASEEYSVVGVNVETGEANLIHEISAFGGTLGYPSFSRSDQILVFDARGEDMFGTITVVKAAFLAENKITKVPQTDAITILEYYYWPVWFSNGRRELNTTSVFNTTSPEFNLVASPNPAGEELNFEITLERSVDMHLQVHDLAGRLVNESRVVGSEGRHTYELPEVDKLGSGLYLVSLRFDDQSVGFKFAKR